MPIKIHSNRNLNLSRTKFLGLLRKKVVSLGQATGKTATVIQVQPRPSINSFDPNNPDFRLKLVDTYGGMGSSNLDAYDRAVSAGDEKTAAIAYSTLKWLYGKIGDQRQIDIKSVKREEEKEEKWQHLADIINDIPSLSEELKEKIIEFHRRRSSTSIREIIFPARYKIIISSGKATHPRPYPAAQFAQDLYDGLFYQPRVRNRVKRKIGGEPARLSSGVNYLQTPRVLVAELIRSIEAEGAEYYKDYSAPMGQDAARMAIVDYENARLGQKIYKKDNVAVTLGATGAIFLAFKYLEGLRAETRQAMDVLIPVPTYYIYGTIASSLGFKVIEIVSESKDRTRFLPTPAEISKAIEANPEIKTIVLSNPNNPTGEIYSQDELNKIISIAKRHGAYVIYDEIFSDLMLTGDRLPEVARIAREQDYLDHVMRVTSWSKDRCLPGFRVGYLLADAEVLSGIRTWPEAHYANPPTVLEGLIARDLGFRLVRMRKKKIKKEQAKDFKSYLQDLKKNEATYRKNLKLVRDKLSDKSRFAVFEPKAAFNLFVRLVGLERLNQRDFVKKLFLEKGVEANPGVCFGLDRDQWEGKNGYGLWVRISFAISTKELERALNGLLEYVDECHGKLHDSK